ncbi:hypothetical protein [Paraburkholderia sp. BL6665CI2N2]|uniref:hypothetical protein n=1 Tax=Paraburkholderia sp. BL6665CI2N2 TaxID=1938806 RepID=UPI001065618D|nr:hypothetical protein [Paraburkholderia sp. BL6665CI2N2]
MQTLPFERQLPRDAQQSSCHRGRTAQRALDCGDLVLHAIEALIACDGHVCGDHEQQIVEIVRYVRDQIAERAHMLMLPRRSLGRFTAHDFAMPLLPCALFCGEAAQGIRDKHPYGDTRHTDERTDHGTVPPPLRYERR